MWPADSCRVVQVAATEFLMELGKSHTEQLKLCLPIIVPILTGATADSKLQVKVRTGGGALPHPCRRSQGIQEEPDRQSAPAFCAET